MVHNDGVPPNRPSRPTTFELLLEQTREDSTSRTPSADAQQLRTLSLSAPPATPRLETHDAMSGAQLPAQLEAAEGIPIAQLSPDIQEPKTRVVRGIVTITWPYSIVKKTIAFLLAEPDFRLRRAKGQVRVEFGGSSAKAVANAALGSGDEITLSLDGVGFVVDDSKTRVPGTSLQWQLSFTERVLLQAKISDSEDVKIVNVDHPIQSEPEAENELPESVLDSFNEREKTPERTATPVTLSSKRPNDQSYGTDEYASPAFLKRARMSYGSLFDNGLDIFDEDVGAKARAKKRVKTGRYSGVWRYASQSPSPDPETLEEGDAEDAPLSEEQLAATTPSRPTMVDDGCQTIERDVSPPRDVQVAAEARQSSSYWQTPSKSTMIDSGVQSDLSPGPNAGLAPDLAFGQPAPMPIFTSVHDSYAPAFQQPPLDPAFGHDLQGGMEPHYDAEGACHEHQNAYPESGLDHGLETHGHYPTSFLDGHNFGPHVAVTSQPLSEPIPAYQDHSQQQGLEAEHHTVAMDRIDEPQQVPWGLTSAQYPRSPAETGKLAVNGQEAGSGTQAVPRDDWAEARERQIREIHEDPEGKQAVLRVEEDQASEDQDGPEEEFASRTYTERHFEPAENDEAATGEQEGSSNSSSESSSEGSEEEAEHEADDAGGDYDITNYRNLSNNQDDDDGTDLESDYGQEEEEEILDPELQGNEDDEVEEDADNYGEAYNEEEDYEDEDEEAQSSPAAPRGGAPEVISLLSDSEDEDEVLPPRPAPVHPPRMPQYDGSTDEIEEDDLYDREESEANHDENEGSSQGSSDSSDEESEEEVSQAGTPTPKPRRMPAMPVLDAPDLTSATIGDDLETMSPIKLPQATGVSESSSQPSSRGNSEMLEAELEKELEDELAADDSKDDPRTPGRPDNAAEASEQEMKDLETVLSSAEDAADVDVKEQTPACAEITAMGDSEVWGGNPRAQPDESNPKSIQMPGRSEAKTKAPVEEDSEDFEDSVDEESKAPVDEDQTVQPDAAAKEAESPQTPDRSKATTDCDSKFPAEENQTLHSDPAADKVDDQGTPEEPEITTAEVLDKKMEEVPVEPDKEIGAATESRWMPDTETKVVDVTEVQSEVAQAVEDDDRKSAEEQRSDLTATTIEFAKVQVEGRQPLQPEHQDTATDQDVDMETEMETEEVTIIPETTGGAEIESTGGNSADRTDIDMTDMEAMSVDKTREEDSYMDMDDMTEEQLIQSQLQEESILFEDQTITTTITTTRIVDERPISHEGKTTDGAEAAQEAEIIETSRVTVETSITEPLNDGDEYLLETAPEDAMDVDEPNDAKSTETASPPPTQHFQSQSFEEIKLVETQSQASEQLEMLDDDAQLLTPGQTQNGESVSQSFVETQATEVNTQVTEANTEVTVPEIDDDVHPQTQEKPENQTASPTTLVRSRDTIEPTLEESNEADATSPINDESSQIRDSSAQPSEAPSSLIAEDPSEEVNAAQPTPRRGRGHRRNRSDTTSKDQDPSVKLARASIASRRSTRLSDRTTPDSTRVTRARSQSLVLKSDSPDFEDDSVQLAKAAIKSPSRAPKEVKPKGAQEKEAVKTKETREPKEKEAAKPREVATKDPKEAAEQTPAGLKAQLTRSLRADVPDCISLKVLRNHPGKAVDVLAIATTEPPEAKRAKGGPRGIMLAFNVTDHSVAPSQTVAVQIFRPHKAALPVVHPGDAILLRNFSVMVLTGRGFGLRANDGSSWAVFERQSQDDLPQIRGPPVELTEGETSYAALLKQWYAGLDAKSLARLDKANEAAPAVGK